MPPTPSDEPVAGEFPPLASEPTAAFPHLEPAGEVKDPSGLPPGGSPGAPQDASPSPAGSPVDCLAGRLLLLAAVLLWSLSGVFAKNGVFDDWPADSRGILLAFWRFLFAGLVLLTAVRRPRWNRLQLPAGMMFGILGSSYLTAMVFTTAANAIWLQSTAPVWVALFAWLLWRRRPDAREAVALSALVLGVAVIGVCEVLYAQGLGRQHVGVFLALVSGACFGGTILVFEKLRDEDGGWIVAVNHLLAAAFLLPAAICFWISPSPVQWLFLIAFGALQMGIPYLLFFLSLRKISSQEAALLSLLEPILAPLWVRLLYGQSPAPWTLVGAALILLGLACLYWPAPKPDRASKHSPPAAPSA